MKKFKNHPQYLTVLLFSFLVISCSEDDVSIDSSYNLDNQVYLKYTNSKGENLLENLTADSYNVKDMNLFYMIDNTPVEVTVENGFNMGSLELAPDNVLRIFTNPSSANVFEEAADFQVVENTAILQLTEADADTIKTHANKGLNSFQITKVWYNNNLVWTSGSDGIIEIIK